MKIILFTTAFLVAMSMQESVLQIGAIGQKLEVVYDRTTKIKGEESPLGDCDTLRDYKVKYAYSGEDHQFIFYNIFQCRDSEGKVTNERAKFSYKKNGKLFPLPTGCPPPMIPPPTHPNPCSMGYKVGQVISRTVANIVVPKLLEEDEQNPFNSEPAFLKLKELQDSYKGSDQESFNEEQEKTLEEYEKMIEEFAKGKIKCFTEQVVPVKKMDIEFICADQGAEKTIEEALKKALGDQISCQHVGCQ